MDASPNSTATRSGPARDRLLAAAADCFYHDGVHATGIDTLTARAGVAKMSLYNNFASKDDLVLAYLEARHHEWLGLYAARLATAGDPRDAVLAVFDAYLDHADQDGFRGCGLLNAAAELPAGAPGRDLVRRHKEQVESLLTAHLADLGLPAGRRSATAMQLAFVLEGAVVRAGLAGDRSLLHHARGLVGPILEDALRSDA